MPEMHLRDPGFTYIAFGPFAKNKERMKKFKEAGYSRYIYQNELDKACFQQDMIYREFKDLNRRTFVDKVLHEKVFDIAKDPKDDGYQLEPTSMVYTFFNKNACGVLLKTKIFLIKN